MFRWDQMFLSVVFNCSCVATCVWLIWFDSIIGTRFGQSQTQAQFEKLVTLNSTLILHWICCVCCVWSEVYREARETFWSGEEPQIIQLKYSTFGIEFSKVYIPSWTDRATNICVKCFVLIEFACRACEGGIFLSPSMPAHFYLFSWSWSPSGQSKS